MKFRHTNLNQKRRAETNTISPPQKGTKSGRVSRYIGESVIVEITNPRSTPMELQAIVSNYGVPVVPILKHGAREFGMFPGLRKFPWVRPTITYRSSKQLIGELRKVARWLARGGSD